MKQLFIALFAAPLLLSHNLTFASPGNDGCVGNCGGGGSSAPVTVTNNNANLNSNIISVKPTIDVNARARAEAYSASLSASKSSAVSNPTLNSTNAATASTGASTSNSGGNTQIVNEASGIHYSGKYEVSNVPNVLIGNVYPTAPCMGSSTIGGSGVGFGIGIGTSWTDDECGIRETARSFSGMGLKDDAVSVLCTSKYASVAPVCNKQKE